MGKNVLRLKDDVVVVDDVLGVEKGHPTLFVYELTIRFKEGRTMTSSYGSDMTTRDKDYERLLEAMAGNKE